MNRLSVPFSLIVAFVLGSHAAASNLRIIDMVPSHEPEMNCIPFLVKNPATLESFEKIQSGTIEKYSDGLIAQVDTDGNRIETWKSGSLQASMPHGSVGAVDYAIKASLARARLRGRASSQLQSRLIQFSRYYLKANEASKSLPLAAEYLEIQKGVGAKGFPFALAESILGQSQTAVHSSSAAIPLLEDAAAYFRNNDQLEYATIENSLGDALLNSGKPVTALNHIQISERVSKKCGLKELNQAARQNHKIAHAAIVASRKLSRPAAPVLD